MSKNKGNISVWLVISLITVVAVFTYLQAPRLFKVTKDISILENTIRGNDKDTSMYTVSVEKLKQPLNHTFEGNNSSPSLFEFERLVFTNKENGEKKSFSLYELLDESILEEFKKVEYEIQESLSINLLKFNYENTHYYGIINIVPGADPPVYSSAGIFKINTQTWEVEKYPLPIQSFFHDIKPEALNTDMETVLIEVASPDNQLYLYTYDFVNKETELIVHYANSIFQEILPGEYGYLGYFHPRFGDGSNRKLDAIWLDNNIIKYTDFVSREEIVKKID